MSKLKNRLLQAYDQLQSNTRNADALQALHILFRAHGFVYHNNRLLSWVKYQIRLDAAQDAVALAEVTARICDWEGEGGALAPLAAPNI